TFYLFKDDDNYESFDDLLSNNNVESFKFDDVFSNIEHRAYYVTRGVPSWVKYLPQIHTNQLSSALRLQNVDYYGMVIFFRFEEKIIAVCLGMGYTLLNHDKIISDFGRRVVINTVDVSRIKSVKTTD